MYYVTKQAGAGTPWAGAICVTQPRTVFPMQIRDGSAYEEIGT